MNNDQRPVRLANAEDTILELHAENERLWAALDEAWKIALGTDLNREAVERIKELRVYSAVCAGDEAMSLSAEYYADQCVELRAEIERLRALLKIAASWMIPFDVMDEDERLEFDKAKAEVEAAHQQQGDGE